MRLWPFRKESREVQFSPALSVMLANYGALARSGVNVTPENALQLMAVLACVRVISEDVASLPLPIYRRTSKGREQAREYGLYELLHDAPNDEMTAMTFRQTMQAYLLLYGNAYANIEVSGGRATALWPIHPTRVSLKRDRSTGKLEYRVTGTTVSEADVNIPLNRMFHIPGLSMNGIQGLSPIGLARETVGLGLASEQFSSGFFKNGAKPSVVFETPKALSEEAHARLRSDLENTLVGLDNAQRTAILEEGMTAKTLFVAPEDAQFLEQRKFGVEEICRLFRVHPHKVAVMEGTQTFASVEEANVDHWVSTVRPWCVRWEQAIRKDLIPAEERATYYAEHEMTAVLRAASKDRAEFYRTLWNIGALSQNDIRELEGMNNIPGGDEYFVPVNMQPARMLMEMQMEPPANVVPMMNQEAMNE